VTAAAQSPVGTAGYPSIGTSAAVVRFAPGTQADVAFTLTGAEIRASVEVRMVAARRGRRIGLAAVTLAVVLILTVSRVVAS
jgi:hypothetical protein